MGHWLFHFGVPMLSYRLGGVLQVRQVELQAGLCLHCCHVRVSASLGGAQRNVLSGTCV